MATSPTIFPGLNQTQINALIAAYAAPLVHTHAAADIASGVLDNARVNWGAPGAIGGTTPAAGAFSSIIFNPGTFASPGLAFSNDLDTGLSNTSNSDMVFLVGGAAVMVATSGGMRFGGDNTGRAVVSTSITSATIPVFTFNADADTGVGRSAANTLALITGGAARAVIADAGLGVGVVPLTRLHVLESTANTVTAANVVTIGANSTGTPGADFGAGLLWTLESGSNVENRSAALDEVIWYVPADAGAIADRIVSAYYNAAGILTKREGFRVRGGATEVLTAVNGATPVARAAHIPDPSGGATVDTEARAAIAAILVAIENFGVVKTS